MLLLASGQTIGTLGGGCVEAEVRQQAIKLLLDKQSKLLTFKLDHDYGWDDGLICGGRMTILADPLGSNGILHDAATDYYKRLRDLAERGHQTAAVAGNKFSWYCHAPGPDLGNTNPFIQVVP